MPKQKMNVRVYARTYVHTHAFDIHMRMVMHVYIYIYLSVYVYMRVCAPFLSQMRPRLHPKLFNPTRKVPLVSHCFPLLNFSTRVR